MNLFLLCIYENFNIIIRLKMTDLNTASIVASRTTTRKHVTKYDESRILELENEILQLRNQVKHFSFAGNIRTQFAIVTSKN